MNQIEIETSQKVQVKFSQFISQFSDILSVPELKFTRDIMRGILTSQSCIIRRIAQSLKEKTDVKKVCERLTYHLQKSALEDRIQTQHLTRTCRSFTNDTLIIVDPSDIAKKYAKKMEGLSKIRDGNTKKIVSGYEVLNIMAASSKDNEIELRPLISKLFSYAQEVDTLKNVLFDHLISTIVASNNKGIFVFDRGYDDKKMFSFFQEQESSFIIRSNGTRDLYYKGRKQKFIEVAKQIKLDHRFQIKQKTRRGKDKFLTVSAGITDVEIPVDPYPRKNPSLVQAKLFVGRYKNGGYWYLLSSLPNHGHLSEFQLIEFILNAYKIRWKIEETHRQVKQDFKWEDLRLGTYKRLQVFNTIFWIAVGFLYSLNSMKYQFIKAFHYLMLDKKNKISKLPDFIYYRIALVVEHCFYGVEKYKKKASRYQRKNKDQLLVPFF